jgi:hypothetical protein
MAVTLNPDGTPVLEPSYMPGIAPVDAAPDVPLVGGPQPSVIANVGEQAATPSPLGPVLGRNRWALTKPAGNYQQVPTYDEAATDVMTGAPSAGRNLTKLGKVFTLLRAAGMGAAVGSTQPTFGGGFLAANQFANQQTAQHLAREQARQNLGMVQTAYGPLPLALARTLLPKEIQAQSARDVANINAESRENVADTRMDSARLLAQSREKIAQFNAANKAQLAGVQGIDVTPEFAKQWNIPPEFVGTKMKATDFAAVRRSSVFEDIPLQTAAGPVIVNRRSGQARPVTGPQGQTYLPPALASPKEIADVNNPGETIVVPGAQAMGQPGVQSASVQVPRALAKAEVPKNVGETRIAFNTAMAHADLLKEAVTALNNGDQNTLSYLKNKFAKEFGSSGPVTAALIADAYSREVQKGLSSNHITQEDTKKIQNVLDVTRLSQQQSLDALDAYKSLFQSKMNQLDQQLQTAADKARSKKGGGSSAPASPKTHVFNAKAWAAANPKGDVNAAIAEAKRQGYSITQ